MIIYKNHKASPGDVWVLLSGGIDSAACLNFYIRRRRNVRCVYVDYGQRSARKEEFAARRIASHYQVPLIKYTWRGHSRKTQGLIQGRNGFLLIGALMERGATRGMIAIGIHSGVSYYDCSGAFAKHLQAIFDGYTNGCVRIAAPFLNWSKRTIWEYCLRERVPIIHTYSCERGVKQPCGNCLSCHDLEVLRAL